MIEDFNIKGYLGGHITEFVTRVRSTHSEFFNICFELNEIGQTIRAKLHIHKHNFQEIIAAVFYLRVLNGFQSVIILCERGLVFDAKIVLRTIIETNFLLKVNSKEDQFYKEYLLSEKHFKLRLLHALFNDNDPSWESVRKTYTKEQIEALEKEVKDKGIKPISAEDMAKRAQSKGVYLGPYRLLSAQVHTLPNSIERFISTDKHGEIDDFPSGPTEEGLDLVLFTSAGLLKDSIQSMISLFKLDTSEPLNKMEPKFSELKLQFSE